MNPFRQFLSMKSPPNVVKGEQTYMVNGTIEIAFDSDFIEGYNYAMPHQGDLRAAISKATNCLNKNNVKDAVRVLEKAIKPVPITINDWNELNEEEKSIFFTMTK